MHFVSCILYLLPLSLLLSRCANPMSPQGGPKDVMPPVITGTKPPDRMIHFSEKDIQITFDEFVQLKDAAGQVIISPPGLEATEYHLRGKTLVVDLKDTLKRNTTYRIDFGHAISDITENNILKGAAYVFSTGGFIDSLSLSGKIVSAFDLSPQKEVLACMYADENDTIPLDSLPVKVPPHYITRSDENGGFLFRNVMDRPLLLVAMKDMNGDRVHDLTEPVAFCDTLVRARYIPELPPDTVTGDSLPRSDTTAPAAGPVPGITLYLFAEEDSVQRLVKSGLEEEGLVKLIFRYPNQRVDLTPLNFDPSLNWSVTEENPGKDTIQLFLRDLPGDTLVLKVTGDTALSDTLTIDLLKFRKKRLKKEAGVAEKLRISYNLPQSKLNHFKGTLELTFSRPLDSAAFREIRLIDGNDTVVPPSFFSDPVHRKIRLTYPWKEEKQYRLFVPDSVFFSLNHLANDTVRLGFMTFSSRELGSFTADVSFPAPGEQYIILLLNEKDQVTVRRIINGPEKIVFDHLLPGKYKVKAIHDRNRNGRWDTGDFRKRLQPEKVFFFPKITEIRPNWDVEESWIMNETR